MGCGKAQAAMDDEEAARAEYLKMLDGLTTYQKDLIISSAWYVVRTFEGKSTIHQQSAALELLKGHLQRHTR